MNSNPLVSVWVITFNQEAYLENTLNGILMQKVNFNYEIVIGEDCSTDNTKEICINFQKKYPEKIKLILNEKNIGMISNFIQTAKACKGKYVAFCEGDDYWVDPLKLQTQVDFLEANPEYGMVCTDYGYLENENIINSFLRYRKNIKIDYDISFDHFILYPYTIRTLTVCLVKNIYDKFLKENDHYDINTSPSGDVPIWGYFAKFSKIRYMAISTGVYRHTPNTASRQSTLDKQYNFSKCVIEIRKSMVAKYNSSHKAKRKVEKEFLMNELQFAYRKNEKSKAFKIILETLRRGFISKRTLFYIMGLSNKSINKIVSRKYGFIEE